MRSPWVLLVILPLAGCISGSDPTDEGPAQAPLEGDGGEAPAFDNSSIKLKNGTFYDPLSAPHTHDYWEGAVEKTILDHTFKFAEDSTNLLQSNLVFTPEGARSVLPGAGRMVFVATYGGSGTLEAWYFFAETATGGKTTLRTGVPWEIPLDKNGWDPPHARRSNWQFGIFKNSGSTSITEVHVTIVIHRSNQSLPLDPPHFDQFEGAQEKLLYEAGFKRSDTLPAQSQARGWTFAAVPQSGEAMKAVPWTSERVVLEVGWSHTLPVPPKFKVTYMTAADVYEDHEAKPDTSSASGATYTFYPTYDDTDSEYAYASLWRFFLWRTDDTVEKNTPYYEVTLTFKITAYKGASP